MEFTEFYLFLAILTFFPGGGMGGRTKNIKISRSDPPPGPFGGGGGQGLPPPCLQTIISIHGRCDICMYGYAPEVEKRRPAKQLLSPFCFEILHVQHHKTFSAANNFKHVREAKRLHRLRCCTPQLSVAKNLQSLQTPVREGNVDRPEFSH